MIVADAVKLTQPQSGLGGTGSQSVNRTTLLSLFQTNYHSNHLLNVLLQSLASIPQIYQSIFQINRPEITSHLVKRKTVYSEPCHVLRGEKCPDASRMFALKYRVRRDLNTDVSVFDWHVRLWLAPRWRLAVVKGLRENCRDMGRAPARKVHTVICHCSPTFGPALFEIWWPDIYLGGPYGPVKDKMYWPKLARRSEKCTGPVLTSRAAIINNDMYNQRVTLLLTFAPSYHDIRISGVLHKIRNNINKKTKPWLETLPSITK